jgi:hypothetical protein
LKPESAPVDTDWRYTLQFASNASSPNSCSAAIASICIGSGGEELTPTVVAGQEFKLIIKNDDETEDEDDE